MVLHFPKISIKNAVKRSCALLAALCIALYSLITAPLFGVHAVDSSQIDKIKEWVELAGHTAVDLLSTDPVGSLIGHLLINVGSKTYDSNINPLDNTFMNSTVDLSTTGAMSGFCVYQGHDTVVSSYTCPTYTFYYTGENLFYSSENVISHRQLILEGVYDGGNFDVYMQCQPYYYGDNSSYNWQDGDYVVLDSVFNTSTPSIMYRFRFYNSSGTAVNRHISFGFFKIENVSGSSYPIQNYWGYSGGPSSSTSLSIQVLYNQSSPPSYDSLESLFPTNRFVFNVAVGGKSSSGTSAQVVGTNRPVQFYQGGTSTINVDNVYNYSNTFVYPNLTRDYPVWQPLPPPSEIVLPTDPTEPNTGITGGVIIIDPFTLPPEWLEDNAELGTSHYELDSDQWEDPLEIIKKYKHADPSGQIPSGAVTDDGRFEGPADVVEAMEAFTDYAYMILTESGLLWVVASLVSVGLIVRLFTLK